MSLDKLKKNICHKNIETVVHSKSFRKIIENLIEKLFCNQYKRINFWSIECLRKTNTKKKRFKIEKKMFIQLRSYIKTNQLNHKFKVLFQLAEQFCMVWYLTVKFLYFFFLRYFVYVVVWNIDSLTIFFFHLIFWWWYTLMCVKMVLIVGIGGVLLPFS